MTCNIHASFLWSVCVCALFRGQSQPDNGNVCSSLKLMLQHQCDIIFIGTKSTQGVKEQTCKLLYKWVHINFLGWSISLMRTFAWGWCCILHAFQSPVGDIVHAGKLHGNEILPEVLRCVKYTLVSWFYLREGYQALDAVWAYEVWVRAKKLSRVTRLSRMYNKDKDFRLTTAIKPHTRRGW